MDPNEISKYLPEAVSVAKVAAASIPFTGIVKRMLGPAADEVAEMMRDRVRIYRYERQVKLLEKVEKIAEEAGFTPQEVPPKILFPLLDGASFEDDENMHCMWSCLLANASSPTCAEKVRPGFVGILKQMSPDEAMVLTALHKNNDQLNHFGRFNYMGGFTYYDLLELQTRLGFVPDASPFNQAFDLRFIVCMDRLESEQLVRRNHWTADGQSTEGGVFPMVAQYNIVVTALGLQFIEACQPPKPKS